MAYGEIPRTIKFDPPVEESDTVPQGPPYTIGFDPTNGGVHNLGPQETPDPQVESDAS